MITFPNAKINLGLNVVSKRGDGYHNIQSLLFPIGLCDVLEIIRAPEGNPTQFTASGIEIPADGKPNLCLRAYELLRNEFGLPGIYIHLHKKIPAGSGLGGGSSDAAFTLKLLNKIFSLQLDRKTLEQMAGSLGSDCPFFIENKPMLASGRGEILEQINVAFNEMQLVLIKPPIHVSTHDAYAGVTPALPEKPISQIVSQPIETWKNDLKNDFESTVFQRFPLLGKIKQDLYGHGAVYAAMSGSGSTIFGLFEKAAPANLAEIFQDCFVWQETIS